jgi:LemA protein
MEIFAILAALAIVPLIYVVATYNALVALRYDLIPNLVATVKGYAAHEKEVLDRVTQLRAQCVASQGRPSEQAVDENQLVAALQRLLAVVENYPQLKADQHFLELQRELVNTENRIQAARRFFNGNVRDYRNKCQSFPSNLVAGLFGFQPEEYFNVDPAVREAPKANFA